MELTLSENIRALRKERKLTQEQFAEIFGVTTGAVYKWESGLSSPELELIVEMADFFDISVDALLGYRMKDNRLVATRDRLCALLRSGDAGTLAEAEKALKKYPHSFEIVHGSAEVYLVLGTESRSPEKLRRALTLLEQALLLIPQNTEPCVSEYTIYGEMGSAYISLGEYEKGLALLKKHNTGGLFSGAIGNALALELQRPEEAEPFLSDAVLRGLASLFSAVVGYAFVYSARGDYAREREIISWGRTLLLELKAADAPSFFDKTHAILLTLLAHAQRNLGEAEEARACLDEAAAHVVRFDAAPDFGLSAVRFVELPEGASLYDGLGLTAGGSVEELLRLLGDEALSALWKEERGHA